MSDKPIPILDFLRALPDLIKRVKNESIAALIVMAILIVFAITALPAEISTQRFVITIVALVLVFGVVLYVLLKLANDRRDFEQKMRRQRDRASKARTKLEQLVIDEKETNERLMKKCASETAKAVVEFGLDLFELDVLAAKRREVVVANLTDWLDYLSEKYREWQEDEVSAWFEAIAAISRREKAYSDFKEIRSQGVRGLSA